MSVMISVRLDEALLAKVPAPPSEPCRYTEKNPDDGETYRCGLAAHSTKVKHGEWVRLDP